MRQNINLYKDMLKIAVCAQHNNGGVYTDCNFETDIEGLYVIGEAAGSFGLSRPGGSALNDTQVGGLVVSKHIKNKATTFTDIAKDIADYSLNFITDETVDYSHFKKK